MRIDLQFPQMECTYNVPSIEEISFKLTENVIPSITNLNPNRRFDDSLDYTSSRVSIQQMLCEDQEPSSLPPQIQQSTFWKNNSLKTTCTGTTQPSTIKKPTKTFFRQRIVSSHKLAEKSSIKRRLSHHLMTFGDNLLQKKMNFAPLHSPHPAPYRQKQSKRGNSSKKTLQPLQKLNKQLELLQLHTSMKVTPVALEIHSTRQKIYLRQVMQNRGSIMNAIDEVSRCPPIWTNRRNFRIH